MQRHVNHPDLSSENWKKLGWEQSNGCINPADTSVCAKTFEKYCVLAIFVLIFPEDVGSFERLRAGFFTL